MSVFSDVKEELKRILDIELVERNLAALVRTSEGYDTSATPYVILTTDGYMPRLSDESHQVDIKVAVTTKFADTTEEGEAETALDDIEQVLIDLFDPLNGTYRRNRPYWGAVDRYQRSWRPFSPLGAGFRYSESYLRFTV